MLIKQIMQILIKLPNPKNMDKNKYQRKNLIAPLKCNDLK